MSDLGSAVKKDPHVDSETEKVEEVAGYNFRRGNIVESDSAFHLAIEGEGFSL